MTPTRARYIQLAGEAAIPLLGFFIWDWSLYFILLFYFFDLVIDEGYTHFKHLRIRRAQGAPSNRAKTFAVGSTTALLIVIIVAHVAMIFIHDGIDFQKEFFAFLTYEELGVPQGAILLPLLLLMAHQQYKMEFAIRGMERTIKSELLWKQQLTKRGFSLILCLACLLISSLVNLPEVFFLLTIVLSSGAFHLAKLIKVNS
jgi:hypothetical protein